MSVRPPSPTVLTIAASARTSRRPRWAMSHHIAAGSWPDRSACAISTAASRLSWRATSWTTLSVSLMVGTGPSPAGTAKPDSSGSPRRPIRRSPHEGRLGGVPAEPDPRCGAGLRGVAWGELSEGCPANPGKEPPEDPGTPGCPGGSLNPGHHCSRSPASLHRTPAEDAATGFAYAPHAPFPGLYSVSKA